MRGLEINLESFTVPYYTNHNNASIIPLPAGGPAGPYPTLYRLRAVACRDEDVSAGAGGGQRSSGAALVQ